MRRPAILVAALAAAVCGGQAAAEVRGADETGFEVGSSETVAADPAQVWQALVRPSLWWDSAHTWSGKAANLTIDPRAGGCFCERLPRGGGVEHMRVIRLQPGSTLVMTGALGPLQAEPVQGVLIVAIAAGPGGSMLTWNYAVSGLRKTKGTVLAEPVNGVLTAQFASLVRYAATGAVGARRRR